VLSPGVDHHIRAEIHNDHLALWVDGRLVGEHRPVFPIGSGFIALYGWDPGKQFDDVRIWQQEVPDRVSPLRIGDNDYRAGRYIDAASTYGDIAAAHQGRPLGEQALYFQGLALHQAGAAEVANSVWKSMPEGRQRWQAECLAIDGLMASGDTERAIARFTQLWKQHPEVHERLHQHWQIGGHHLRKKYERRNEPQIRAWLTLRDTLFPEHLASRWLAAEMLGSINAWEELLRRFPDERPMVVHACLALGRSADILASNWAQAHDRIVARIHAGDFLDLLDGNQLSDELRSDLLCRAGRPADAAKIAPFPAALYLGGMPTLFAKDALGSRTNDALIACGRFEDAAGPGVPGLPLSGRSGKAMILLGRYDDAGRAGKDVSVFRLFDHLLAGRLEEALALRPLVEFNANRFHTTMWFDAVLGYGLIDEALGKQGALREAVERGTTIKTGWGGRVAPVCAAILDPTKEAEFEALPWRNETVGWRQIIRAMRGELAGDRTAARDGWLAFKALPFAQRLIDDHSLNETVEAFASWRIAALSAKR
jgi:hypothetical protein